jgi:hypothetical protein
MGRTTIPRQVAGIPVERLVPLGDGSVREYDRPFWTETEGVGRHQDPEARRIATHEPGSEVAEAIRPITEERSKPRPVTRRDIAQMEEAREVYAAQGKTPEADACHRTIRRVQAGLAISARRRGAAPTTRARGAGRPAGRPKAQSTRSSARSGDSGEDGSEPPLALRECEWCGESIEHLNADARYCGAKHRVSAARARDKADPDRVAARAVENGVHRRPQPCRCSPQGHLVIGGVCFHCGRARGDTSVWLRGARELKVREVVTRAPARKAPRTGDGKRRPKRVYVDESIIRQVAA